MGELKDYEVVFICNGRYYSMRIIGFSLLDACKNAIKKLSSGYFLPCDIISIKKLI